MLTEGGETDSALSFPYLCSAQSVLVHDKVSVEVVIVESGATLAIDAKPCIVQTCIIHSGKLDVCFRGEEGSNSSRLGPGSVVSLLPTSRGCTMANPFYAPAVLHKVVSNIGGC